jgi:hypothetical protein
MTYLYLTAFAYTFAELSGIPQMFAFVVLGRDNRQFKPFTCSMCLSFWLVLIYSICEYLGWHGFGQFFNLIGSAFLAFVLTGWVLSIIKRIT